MLSTYRPVPATCTQRRTRSRVQLHRRSWGICLCRLGSALQLVCGPPSPTRKLSTHTCTPALDLIQLCSSDSQLQGSSYSWCYHAWRVVEAFRYLRPLSVWYVPYHDSPTRRGVAAACAAAGRILGRHVQVATHLHTTYLTRTSPIEHEQLMWP